MADNLPEIISLDQHRLEQSVSTVTSGQKDFPTDHLGQFIGQEVKVTQISGGSRWSVKGRLQKVDPTHFVVNNGSSHPFPYNAPGHIRVYTDLKDEYGEPFDIKVGSEWVPADEKIYDNS